MSSKDISTGTNTRLLNDARDGDYQALEEVWTRNYDALRTIAGNLLRGDGLEHQVSATELVHEGWSKSLNDKELPRNSGEFFGRTFRQMSQKLIDLAREQNAAKRGGGWTRRPFTVVEGELCRFETLHPEQKESVNLIMEAWQKLDEDFHQEATVAFCRLFLGLGNDQTASLLELTPKQASTAWRLAASRLRIILDAECGLSDDD